MSTLLESGELKEVESISLDLLDHEPKKKKTPCLWIALAIGISVSVLVFAFIHILDSGVELSLASTPTSDPWIFEKYLNKQTGELTFPENLDWKEKSVVIEKHDGVKKILFMSSSFMSVLSLSIRELPNLELFEIRGYKTLSSLTALYISYCSKLTDFTIDGDGALSKLSFSYLMNFDAPIRRISLSGSDLFMSDTSVVMEKGLSSLESISLNGDHMFTSAESLKIKDMSLKSWSVTCFYCFSKVKVLTLDNCPQLTSLTFDGENNFESVTELSWNQLDSLKTLTITSDESFTNSILKLENLKSLEKVLLKGESTFSESASMTFSKLDSLKELQFGGDHSYNHVKTLTMTELPALTLFRIQATDSFNELESLSFNALPSLEDVEFVGSSLLKELKQLSMNDVASLKSLLVQGEGIAPSVATLTVNAPSLKSVYIQGDKSLTAFLALPLDSTNFPELASLTVIQPRDSSPLKTMPSWSPMLENVHLSQQGLFIEETRFVLNNLTHLKKWRVESEKAFGKCSEFSMTDLPELESFVMNANDGFSLSISEVSISNMPKLKTLKLEGSNFMHRCSSIMITNNPQLEEISLRGYMSFQHSGSLIIENNENLKSFFIGKNT